MAKQVTIAVVTTLDAKGLQAAEKQIAGLSKAQAQAAQSSAAVARANATVAQSAQKVAAGHNAVSVSASKAALAQNQVAISAAKLAKEEAAAAGALIKNEAAMSKSALAALRLEQAQAKAASGTRSLSDRLGDLQGAVGALGLAVGTQQLLAFGKASIDLSNSTTQAENALRALAGSPELYASALKTAREQQVLFGGSLQDNISGIQGLITVSRDSGIELQKLVDLSQRLAVKDPAQGAAGARIALQEAFSGDPTSLAKRYEIPKAALAALRDESTTSAEKLAILDGYLNKIGITSEVAAGSVTKSAQQLNAFAQATESAQRKVGDLLAAIAGNAAEGTLNLVNLAGSGEKANTTLSDLAGAIGQYIAVSSGAPAATLTYGDAIDQATGKMLAWVGIVDGAIAAQSGKIAVDVAGAAAQEKVASATLMMGGATNSVIDGLLAERDAKIASEQEAQRLASTQERLASLGAEVNAGHLTAAQGAAILAAQYGKTADEALYLINLQAQLAGGAQRLADQKAQTRDLVPGGVGVNAPGKRGQSDADILATVQKTTDEITAVGVRAQPVRTAAVKAGGSARASAEQSSADKIKQIAEDTAAKLVAIDQRAAEQRAKAQASLANAISESSADMVANHEADDLELIGASEDRIAELTAREQAQAQARIASINAVQEARAIADAGDAEQAQKVLDARQAQIAEQQQLDEDYAAKQAELAGNPEALAAAKQQYDEATQAFADAAQVRIDFAAQEAQQRADALAAEKQAVLDGADAQVAALGKTGSAADTAASKVKGVGDAIAAIPTHTVVTIDVVENRSSSSGAPAEASRAAVAAPNTKGSAGSGGDAKLGGGGTLTGVTNGPMTVDLGDNPGGREAYAITAVPLSGTGTSIAGPGRLSLAGGTGTSIGGASDDAIKRLEDANRRQILPISSGGATAKPKSGGGGGGSGGDAKASVDEALKNEKEALQLIKDVADLRKELRKGVPPPIAATLIADLSAEAARISTTVRNTLVPTTKEQVEALSNWSALVGDSVSILKDVGSLSADLFRDYQRPSREQIGMFVGDAQEIARQVDQAARIYQSDALENAKTFSEGVGATFSAIGEGLRVIDQLRFGDLTVDVGKLQQFQDSSLAILNTADILAARADRIDQNALASLSTATSAINAQAEALINLSAVPFGNLGGLAAGLGGGSSSSVTFGPGSIVINGAQGMDMSALANLVAQRIGSQIGSRR